jgi:hypothetical protein
VTEFFAAPFRLGTYKRLGYLLLAFPLGLAYFLGLTVGGSVGLGLAVTWVGIPILLGTLLATTAVAGVEAKLTTVLLDREVSVPPAFRGEFRRADEGYLDALRRFLAEPTTWTSVALVFVRFVFGIVAFTATVTAGATVVALLAAPITYDDPNVSYAIAEYAVDTFPEAIGVACLGVAWLFVATNLLNVLAGVGGRLTEAFLSAGGDASYGRA